MPAIETNGLTKRYDEVTAVSDLDLTVETGEVFGFLGPNGAGKSTTINMLLGFLQPSNGRATVLGHDVQDDPGAVRSRVGLLPDGYQFFENLTGREHVISAIETRDANDEPDEIIERVGLGPSDARRAVSEYSKGMRQRLALGIALVDRPDLLILDEPSSGLDPEGIKRLREIVRNEVESGTTVFFSSHLLDQVEKICDRVGIMYDGELVAVDHISDLKDRLGANAIEATVETAPDPSTLLEIDEIQDVTVDGDTIRVVCSSESVKMMVLEELNEYTTVRNFETGGTSLESLFEEFTSGNKTDDRTEIDDRVTVRGGE